ncbi:hypothetical protein F4859DRAFT_457357, partial [Xylaria cf. heliscus]
MGTWVSRFETKSLIVYLVSWSTTSLCLSSSISFLAFLRNFRSWLSPLVSCLLRLASHLSSDVLAPPRSWTVDLRASLNPHVSTPVVIASGTRGAGQVVETWHEVYGCHMCRLPGLRRHCQVTLVPQSTFLNTICFDIGY